MTKITRKKLPRLALGLYASVFIAAYAAPVSAGNNVGMSGASAGSTLFSEFVQVKHALQLDALQENKWQAAEAATRRAKHAMLKDHERLQALMAQPGQTQLPGPLNIDVQTEAIQVEGRVARDLACASWLAAYESLNEAQKLLASEHIAQAVSRIGSYANGGRAAA